MQSTGPPPSSTPSAKDSAAGGSEDGAVGAAAAPAPMIARSPSAPSSSAAPPPLPEGWSQFNAADKAAYYQRLDRSVKWERPPAAPAAQPPARLAPELTRSSPAAAALPSPFAAAPLGMLMPADGIGSANHADTHSDAHSETDTEVMDEALDVEDADPKIVTAASVPCHICEVMPVGKSHLYCYFCGERACDTCRATCEIHECCSGAKGCDECVRQCDTCSKFVCPECAHSCEACGEEGYVYCKDCMSPPCRSCGTKFCGDCQADIDCLDVCSQCGDGLCKQCQSSEPRTNDTTMRACRECGVTTCLTCCGEWKWVSQLPAGGLRECVPPSPRIISRAHTHSPSTCMHAALTEQDVPPLARAGFRTSSRSSPSRRGSPRRIHPSIRRASRSATGEARLPRRSHGRMPAALPRSWPPRPMT